MAEPQLTQNAIILLQKRYLLRDSDGKIIETPRELFWRVARAVAQAERIYHPDSDVEKIAAQFYELLSSLKFLPNCVAGDTLVATRSGLIPIRELCSANQPIEIPTDSGWALATEFYSNGPNKALKVTTQHGYQIVATPKHFFRVVDSRGNYVWKQLEQISPQDRLVLQLSFLNCIEAKHQPKLSLLNLPDGFKKESSSENLRELAEFLGYLHGKGELIESHHLRIWIDQPDILEWIRGLLSRSFGVEPKIRGNWIFIDSAEVAEFLKLNGWDKSSGIPRKILRASPELIRHFLRGLFEAIGCVHRNSIQLSSNDDKLIREIQVILLGLGIVSKLEMEDGCFKLKIEGDYRDDFLRSIGFLSKSKQEKANADLCRMNPDASRCSPDLELQSSKRKTGIDTWAGCINHGVEHGSMGKDNRRFQFYDRIACLEPVEVDTYDIHVPSGNTYIANGFVVHNSPTLMNAGTSISQLSACFVIPIEDSMESIFDALKAMAIIQKSGGGTGFDFSKLRPEGDLVRSTSGIASGPCSFIKIFDSATEQIKQGGRRRGANMGILRCDHPDILKFIELKSNPQSRQLTNFNLSVAVTDEFMRAVEQDREIHLINPRTNAPVRKIRAREIFDRIVKSAWATGDPGLIFIDTINRYHPLPDKITATNPCIPGDTLIAVADGRNAVPIEDLAREAKPVPVYCKDGNGNTQIGWAREIRLTRRSAPVYEVTLDDASSFRATPDHLVMLSDGSYAPVIKLKPGDRLMGFEMGLDACRSSNRTISSIEFAGYEDVYDMHVDAFHNFCIITNGCSGVVLHNCGEQPLLPWESCNLGSINLAKFVRNGEIDWDDLGNTVKLAVRFLDNVIDVNQYPLAQIEQATKANRKIGLGVMGWADMLVQLRIRYDSQQAIQLAEKVMEFITQNAVRASMELADQRGVFPNWPRSKWAAEGIKLRNATLTTIAPTGSLSIIAGCSSGIEPLYALVFQRNVLDGQKLVEINPYLIQELEKRGIDPGILERGEDLPPDLKEIFVTAHQISYEWHVKMQAAFQKHTHNAVSKTINLPNSASPEDIANAFMLAWKLGCKGITVFRDGCLSQQVLQKPGDGIEEFKRRPRPRPDTTWGKTLRIKTGCGNLFVTINEDEKGMCEVFLNIGRSGGCSTAQCEAIGRLISLALRSGIDVEAIIDQLRGIRCPMLGIHNGRPVYSCADGVARALEIYLGMDQSRNPMGSIGHNPQCQECGSILEHSEGCLICRNCGYSRC